MRRLLTERIAMGSSSPGQGGASILRAAILLFVIAGHPAMAEEQVAHNMAPAVHDPQRTSIDLHQLEARLRGTPTISLMTKLQFKAELDEILEAVGQRESHDRSGSMQELKSRFFSLAHEAASRLEKSDPRLARTIASSRDAIWRALLRRQAPARQYSDSR